MMNRSVVFLMVVLFLSSCNPKSKEEKAEKLINAKDISQYASTLASDEFQGRKPFSKGEEKTVTYLAEIFKKIGLKPGFEGSYFQDVLMVEITYKPSKEVTLNTKEGDLTLHYLKDYIATTPHIVDEVQVEEAPLVFAGYGIVAPEYGWDDYKNLDVQGKVVMVLVNDPGFGTQNDSLFKGNAMTYYGRWTYKYEEAARQGAIGVLVIHNAAAAGYPWQVLVNTADTNFYLDTKDANADKCVLNGWITEDAVQQIFIKNGLNFTQVKANALQPDFKSVVLPSLLNIKIENELSFGKSKNVVGYLEGTEKPEESIVFSAHWDHFGIGPVHDGDSIYNGAADNAIAVASMLETARALAKAPKTKRSMVFVAVTAEETGLLGSAFYAENPISPQGKMIANLNYELLLPMGRMKDVTITGFGQSELEKYVEAAAKTQDRYVAPEPFPENGMYFRSDHFSFARKGVPSLFFKGWQESREHGKDWANEQINAYWQNTYHKPSDEFHAETADLSGVVEDTKLFFKIGYRLANESIYPQWYETSEFKNVKP